MTSKQLFDSIKKEHSLDFWYESFMKATPKDILRFTTKYPELQRVLSAYNLEKLSRKERPYAKN